VDYINGLLDKIPLAQWFGSAVVALRESAAISRSIAALVFVTGILVVHSYWETRPSRQAKLKTKESSGDRSLTATPHSESVMGPIAKTIIDQFMTVGDDGEQKIKISGVEHRAGILVEVVQILDRDHALPCEVILTDLKKIENGQPYAVPEIHKPDGSFKYGRVALALATNDSNLYFSSPQRWWLMQQRYVNYYWGAEKTSGAITLSAGTWNAYLEVTIGPYKFNREFMYAWSESNAGKLV
jgi:hypothetical protein